MGQLPQALDDANRAIDLGQGDPRYLVTRAAVLAAQDNLAQALRDLNSALETDPGLAQALLQRGEVYEKQGETQKAIDDFNRILAIPASDEMRQKAEEALQRLRN